MTVDLDQQQERERRSQLHRRGKTMMVSGAVLAGVGLLITIGTFAMAGGGVIIAYGAIIAGGYRMFRGSQMMT
jgi:hypothetical protein